MIAAKIQLRDLSIFRPLVVVLVKWHRFKQFFNQSPPNRGWILYWLPCADLTHVVTPQNDQRMPKRRDINFVCQIWYRFVVLRQF